MTGHEVRLITVSREFGAGGSELATELGHRLGWPVLDHDIVHRVAERLQLDEGTVQHFDEHAPPLLARIATVLVIPQPEIYSFPVDDQLPSHDAIAGATRAEIEQAASALPIIVVGHGAQCIFAGRDEAFHVRLVAPLRARLARIMSRMSVDAASAGALLRRADHDRQQYVQRYFRHDWRNELLYDLQVNTGRMSIVEAAESIVSVIRGRTKAGNGSESEATPSR